MSQQSVSHRERMQAVISGQKPDRAPVALWRHFPVDDQNPQRLAAAVSAFQRQFDFDLIKVTPSSSFCLYDWGAADTWKGNPEGTREYGRPVISTPADWERLPVLDPHQGALAAQLACLKQVTGEFSSRTPVLQTIFSPLSQAKNLVGKTHLTTHLRRYPEAVMKGLETITRSTLRFVEACCDQGVDGIFYAVQHAQSAILSEQEYLDFGKPGDLQILEAAGKLWLNMLHLHGEDVMFDLLAAYPVQMINWHDRQTEPDLAAALTRYPGVVVGGLRQWETMVLGTPEQVTAEAQDALAATAGMRFVLGTGCVLPITAPYGNITAARQAVEGV